MFASDSCEDVATTPRPTVTITPYGQLQKNGTWEEVDVGLGVFSAAMDLPSCWISLVYYFTSSEERDAVGKERRQA